MFKNLFSSKKSAITAPVVDESYMDLSDEKVSAIISTIESNGIPIPDSRNLAFALTYRNGYWGGSMEYTEAAIGYRIIAENLIGTRTITRVYVINYNERYSEEKLVAVNATLAAVLNG